MMTAAIQIEGLAKTFGRVRAVDGITLEVPKGSIFGFLGANGAGKTTTLRMIAGLARPSSGTIVVAGHTSAEGTAYRRRIGYLCQDPAFYGWMTGREVLAYAAGFHPELGDATEGEIERLIDLVGLRDAADRRCDEYSGGMKQRLGIGAALIGRPEVLLLDEPATGLDPLGRKDVLDLMESLRETTTVFYSTHILDDVQRVSDRVAVIDHGKLLLAQKTSDLLSSYSQNRLRVELVGASPETALRLAAIPGVTGVTALESTTLGLTAAAFAVTIAERQTGPVQAAITRLAHADGMSVVEARLETLDLEEVFLRLVGNQEFAA
jgi:ABC-2 type transport system ATP-binding protein